VNPVKQARHTYSNVQPNQMDPSTGNADGTGALIFMGCSCPWAVHVHELFMFMGCSCPWAVHVHEASAVVRGWWWGWAQRVGAVAAALWCALCRCAASGLRAAYAPMHSRIHSAAAMFTHIVDLVLHNSCQQHDHAETLHLNLIT